MPDGIFGRLLFLSTASLHSLLYLVRREFHLTYILSNTPSRIQDSLTSCRHAFRHFRIVAILHSSNHENQMICNLEWAQYTCPEVPADCPPANIQTQRTNHFRCTVWVWHCLSLKGSVWYFFILQSFYKQGFTL